MIMQVLKSRNDLYCKSFLDKCDNDVHINDFNLSLNDVKDAISQCKNNKSPGLDGITNELIKNGGQALEISLYKMFLRLRELENVPNEWNKGIIIPIHKKGKKCDLNNYRGITLNSCVSKIYNRLITKSISTFLEENNILSEIQGGFREDHRCEDHIFTLKSIVTCRQAEKKQTFLAFLDFKKAFDSVWREGLFNAIWETGIKGRLWRILSNCMYNNVQCQVKFGNTLTTDFFDVEEGVKQGCVLSPVLFCVLINNLAKMIKKANLGVNICDVQIGTLFWADDVVLIADNKSELQKMLDIATDFALKWKLAFNHTKSNVVIAGRQDNLSNNKWVLGKNTIKEIHNYKYLGVQISSNMSDHKHIDEVIKKGNRIIAYIRSNN